MNDYLKWHYHHVWNKIIIILKNLFLFPIYFFAVPLHLKTLLSPWKRQLGIKKAGFRLNNVAGVIAFNLTSRLIGLIVRITVILYGLILSLLLPLIFLPFVLIWPVIPFLSYPFYLKRKNPPELILEEVLSQNNFPDQLQTLCQTDLGRFIFLRLGLNPQKISKIISGQPKQVSANSYQEFNNHLTKLLNAYFPTYNLKEKHLTACYRWYIEFTKQTDPILLLSSERISRLTGIGSDWAYGYTVNLDKYSQDLTKKPIPYPFLLGRDQELKELERALLKSENNNVLIIGEPGIGRHILIETLAHNLSSGKCDPKLVHKRILQLDMHSLFAASEDRDKLKALFSDLLEEALAAGNIIIFIDNIGQYVSVGEERIDLTIVLEKFAQSRVGIIGLITPDEFHTYIEKSDTLNKIFNKVWLQEPPPDLVMQELELSIVPVLESKYPVTITLTALEKTIQDCDRFLSSTPFPGKAVELLEETVIFKTSEKRNTFLLDRDIDDYLARKLKLPLGELNVNESEKLANLESFLHQKVINQNQAIRLIAGALRRSRLSISSSEKPIASFLFLGPTGVGKTETAKALNEIYFRDSTRLIRFDMSQYQGEAGLVRLIGSRQEKVPGELTSRLREKPYGVLLFDEIEKAPSLILNLFLTLLDEGYLTDGSGKKVDCRNTIIISTSNAASEYIRERLIQGLTSPQLSDQITSYILKNKIFSPEFVNRFDQTIVFTPLSEGQLKEVARLMLENLNRRLEQRELNLDITPELVNYLAGLGSNREFGARSIRREIESNIENIIARKVLTGQVPKNRPIRLEIGT